MTATGSGSTDDYPEIVLVFCARKRWPPTIPSLPSIGPLSYLKRPEFWIGGELATGGHGLKTQGGINMVNMQWAEVVKIADDGTETSPKQIAAKSGYGIPGHFLDLSGIPLRSNS